MDGVAIKALEKILQDGGSIANTLYILLVFLLVWRERFWTRREADTTAAYAIEIKSYREREDKLRDALLAETKSTAETIAVFRAQISQWQIAMERLFRLAEKGSAT